MSKCKKKVARAFLIERTVRINILSYQFSGISTRRIWYKAKQLIIRKGVLRTDWCRLNANKKRLYGWMDISIKKASLKVDINIRTEFFVPMVFDSEKFHYISVIYRLEINKSKKI